MNWDISQFHFIRPLWLILLPVLVIAWHFARLNWSNAGWDNYLPSATIRALRLSNIQKSSRWQWWLITSLLALVLAAAGPTWTKQPVPIFKNQDALVIILDLSPSMLAEDLKPNRLTRAKHKLIDIIRKKSDGQVALIAFAGDAHTVSPLTDDPATIEALLPALHPNIMPSRGSNAEASIDLAQQLLSDAGASSGGILLITDGITAEAINQVSKRLQGKNSLSILGVGGTDAVPIPVPDGGFLRKINGEIVLAGVNTSELRELASSLGGRFSSLQTDESDINHLLRDRFNAKARTDVESSTNAYDSWADMGHWLVLLVLPFAVFCFRKGFIYMLPLMILLPFDSQAAAANGFSWGDLWQTPDQQAAELMQQKQYSAAAEKFRRSDWSAIANYRNGDFAEAARQFSTTGEPVSKLTDLYNMGNAQAFNGDLEKAIDSYQQVLDQQPDHADAVHNKQVVEQLLQQRQEQAQQQQNPQDQQNQQDSEQSGSPEQQQSAGQDSPESEQQQSRDPNQEQQSSAGDQPQSSNAQQPTEESEQANQSPSEAAAGNKDNSEEPSESPNLEQSDQELAQSQQQEESSSAEDVDQSNEFLAEKSGSPLKDSSEQWLRTIQDDPSGLLRRKFEYQARQRAQQGNTQNQPESNSTEDRY